MTNFENDLTSSYKSFDAKVKDLEGIFTKIKKILDISEYQKEFNQIQLEARNDPSLANKMTSDIMQLDYENFIFSTYIKRLNQLMKKIERDLLPYYELYLLTSKIDIQISDINSENIGETIQNTKKLIDLLNKLNTHNEQSKKELIEKAYKTIYDVIMYEEIFERNDILFYIINLNIAELRENIGRLLTNDLKNLSKEDLIDEDLRTLSIEGLGYDYLNPELIQKISRKTVGEKNSEYQERKRQAISDLFSKIELLSNQKKELETQLQQMNHNLKNIYIKKSLLFTKVLSLIMIPIITINAGKAIGKNASNKITEYKTVTRTINLDTGEIIGTPIETFEEQETTYVATILESGPWRPNPTGIGYIHNVTAYEYIVPEDIPEDYHITKNDLNENIQEKYTYIEPKDSLDSNDSTSETTILITETYQDKKNTQKSTKYIIPFTILGTGLSIPIDIVLFTIFNLKKFKEMMEKLNQNIKDGKLCDQKMKEELSKIKEKGLQLKEEYNLILKKYGTLDDQARIAEENMFDLNQNKRIRKH